MKNLKVFLCGIILSTNLWAGDKAGGGGDSSRLEFRSYAFKSAAILQKSFVIAKPITTSGPVSHSCKFGPTDIEGSTCSKIIQALTGESKRTPKVVFVEESLFNLSQEVDALNFKDHSLIKVNFERWASLTNAEKTALAFHETVGAMGFSLDASYTYSNVMKQIVSEEEGRLKFECMASCVYNPTVSRSFNDLSKKVFYYKSVKANSYSLASAREKISLSCLSWMNSERVKYFGTNLLVDNERPSFKPLQSAPASLFLVSSDWQPGLEMKDYPINLEVLGRDCKEKQ